MVMPEFPWERLLFPICNLGGGTGGASVEMTSLGLDPELEGNVPFEIKSVELVKANRDEAGEEAIKVGGGTVTLWNDLEDQAYSLHHTTQVVMALSGGCDLMLNDGVSWRDLNLQARLSRPDEGRDDDLARAILIKPGVWREFKAFSPGTILMILSSDVPGDVSEMDGRKVRDWAEFMDRIGQAGKQKGRP